jgi:hypothetical protein
MKERREKNQKIQKKNSEKKNIRRRVRSSRGILLFNMNGEGHDCMSNRKKKINKVLIINCYFFFPFLLSLLFFLCSF